MLKTVPQPTAHNQGGLGHFLNHVGADLGLAATGPPCYSVVQLAKMLFRFPPSLIGTKPNTFPIIHWSPNPHLSLASTSESNAATRAPHPVPRPWIPSPYQPR